MAAKQDISDRNLSLGAPRFVEPSLYNAFDHNGSPLGLIEREKGGVHLGLRYLGTSETDSDNDVTFNSNNIILPMFGFTIPDILSSRFYYRNISDEVAEGGNDNHLVLRSGGMDLAWGSKSKYFQMGLSLHAMMGEANDSLGNKRFLLNVPKFDVSMGSQFHPTVRFGIHYGAAASLDTLNSASENPKTWERIGDVEFPNWGMHFDVGDTSILPLLSNISLNFYKMNQIGTWKQNVNNVNGNEYQYNPIWHSGHDFRWKSTYYLTNHGLKYWPSLLIEQWNRKAKRYRHGDDKQDPYSKGVDCVTGTVCNDPDNIFDPFWNGDGTTHEWFYSGINFGLGGYIQIFDYTDVFAEWEMHTISYEGEEDKNKFYNRILVGAQGNLHNIPQWNVPEFLEIYLRGSFSTGEENSLINSFHPYQFEYYDRYTVNLGNRDYTTPSNHQPEFGTTVDWFSFNFGFGAGFYKIFSADLYFSFYNKDFGVDKFSGYELGTTTQLNF